MPSIASTFGRFHTPTTRETESIAQLKLRSFRHPTSLTIYSPRAPSHPDPWRAMRPIDAVYLDAFTGARHLRRCRLGIHLQGELDGRRSSSTSFFEAAP